jgi:hypothetical protein
MEGFCKFNPINLYNDSNNCQVLESLETDLSVVRYKIIMSEKIFQNIPVTSKTTVATLSKGLLDRKIAHRYWIFLL